MKIKEGFVISRVGDKTVAVASGALSREFHGMITLNESGKLLFDLLRNDTTEERLIKALVDEYGITTEQAQRDVTAFLTGIRNAGLLV